MLGYFRNLLFFIHREQAVQGSEPRTRAVLRESKFQNSNPRTNGFQKFFLQKLRFSTGRTGRTVGATAAVGCLPDRIRRALYGKHGGVVVRSTVWILAFFKSAQNHLSATLRKQPIILSILTFCFVWQKISSRENRRTYRAPVRRGVRGVPWPAAQPSTPPWDN